MTSGSRARSMSKEVRWSASLAYSTTKSTSALSHWGMVRERKTLSRSVKNSKRKNPMPGGGEGEHVLAL